jgi:GxxExxY protein
MALTENDIASIIIEHAINVHRNMGPGLLESVYHECLFFELANKGLKVEKEKPIGIDYGDVSLNRGYRIDMLVENKVVVEIKAVDCILPIHIAQTLTYLKLGDYKLGLLLNFNVVLLKHGIKRLVNNL